MLSLSQISIAYLFFMGAFFVLYIGKASSHPLLEVIKVLWLFRPLYSCQSTDDPGWLPPRLSRKEKFRI